MEEADQIIRETREMIDQGYINITGKPAPDDAVMLSLATQLYLARKALENVERPKPPVRIAVLSDRYDQHDSLRRALAAASLGAVVMESTPPVEHLKLDIIGEALTGGEFIETEKPREPWRRGRPLR